MSFKRIVYFSMSLAFMSFSGCVSTPPPKPINVVDPCLTAIKASANNIHDELIKLTRVQQQKTGSLDQIKIVQAPTKGVLSEPIVLKWAGPVETVTKMLADMIGYSFKVTGQRPSRDKLVNINALNKPVFEVLEDIGWQAGEKIGLLVDQEHLVIKLAYEGGV